MKLLLGLPGGLFEFQNLSLVFYLGSEKYMLIHFSERASILSEK